MKEIKEWLSNQGIGTGTNLTISSCAELISRYASDQCRLRDELIKAQDELIEILKRQIHVSGLLYPSIKSYCRHKQIEELEQQINQLINDK